MSLLTKLLATLSPLWDFRAWLCITVCAVIGMCVDPAATLGLAGYLAYVIGMWGAALMLAKILTPYIQLSLHVRSALDEGNTASALIVLARVLLIVCIAISIMAWGK